MHPPTPYGIFDPEVVRCEEIDDDKDVEDRELKHKRKASTSDEDKLKKARLKAIQFTSTEIK